jgi:hypothetical protein
VPIAPLGCPGLEPVRARVDLGHTKIFVRRKFSVAKIFGSGNFLISVEFPGAENFERVILCVGFSCA